MSEDPPKKKHKIQEIENHVILEKYQMYENDQLY